VTSVLERPQGAVETSRRRFDWLGIGLPALIAYVPLLLTHRGMVGADTKTYLYLDPGKLISEAPYLWNTDIGLGTVTHQNIGYLWPMGPFYFFFEALNVPDWVAQRLWLGSIIFLAGMGVRFLLRTIGWGSLPLRRGGVLVATLAYMLSPYVLNYSARISVILLPFTALPWLIALTARALRRGGWFDPALIALIVLTVGGVNATALLLIGLGPLLWILHTVFVDREASVREGLATSARILVLIVATSMWWITGLWAQGKYGLPVVKFTETYEVVARASSAPEVLRGLGYWLFYGRDQLGQWIEPSITYTRPLPLALSYAVPLLAMVAAALLRWRFRAFFLTLMAVGALAAIASNPWDDSSVLGGLFKEVTRTEAGLSLRSTPRAVPLVALGLSVCLGAGVAALGRRIPRLTWPATALVALMVIGNFPTLWNGQMIASNLERPEEIPSYWNDAAAYLTANDDGTRALEVPGADFASYRWGNTIDPVTPGLTERQYAARELFLLGSPQAADLQAAFDQRFHEDSMDPEAIAPISRLLGVGDIVLRNDLKYERYRLARPRYMWDLLNRTPGLGEPVEFGPTTPNVAGPELPLIDEIELATPSTWDHPPAVAIFPVENPLLPTTAKSAKAPLLLSGSGDGIVDYAGLGALDPVQALFYSASFQGEQLDELIASDAQLVITDTNRKRARSWNTIRENAGYTEQADETSLVYDPGDQRLDLFPGAGDDAYTVTQQTGGVRVFATDYGTRGTLTINDRATGALDGDPLTAWRVGDGSNPVGQRLVIVPDGEVTADRIRLLQPQTGVQTRSLTRVRLLFDGADPVVVDLDESSRTAPGQTVEFDERTFQRLEIEVEADTAGPDAVQLTQSGVGFAEVDVAGLRVEEVVRPPVDLLRAAGPASVANPLSYVFTRLRSNPAEPVRTDPELAMARIVDVPAARAFGLGGQARINPAGPDATIDALLGIPGADAGGLTVEASESLAGALRMRPMAALDGDPSTAWSTPFVGVADQWIDVTLPERRTIDRLDLRVVADGRHSVPTRVTLIADDDPSRARSIEVPEVVDSADPNATAGVPLEFEALEGTRFRVRIDEVRPVTTIDWYSQQPITMPAAIAELGIPGVTAPPVAPTVDTGCRNDLLTIDGAPLPVRVTGPTEDALDRRPLDVELCESGGSGAGLSLDAGEHVLTAAPGRELGLDLDRLVLTSAAGGAAASLSSLQASTTNTLAPVESERTGGVGFDLTVPPSDEVRWLSFGQSWNPGWKATVDGRDLGPSVVIDGYASGWKLDPAEVGTGPLEVRVDWTPQRVIWFGILLSGVAVVACLVLIVVGARSARRRRTEDAARDLLAADAEAESRRGHRALPIDPELSALPWARHRAQRTIERASPRAALVASLVLLLIFLPNVPLRPVDLVMAIGVAMAAWAAFRSPRGRGVLGLLGATCFGVAAIYIVFEQRRRGFTSEFYDIVDPVHTLALAAVLLLFAEGVRDVLVRRESVDHDPPRSDTTPSARPEESP
jgi:arabinofuranan 3-O-arabinosyltransferase